MRKTLIGIVLSVFLIQFQSVYAYTPTNQDSQILALVENKLETIAETNLPRLATIQKKIDKYLINFENSSRLYYILNQMSIMIKVIKKNSVPYGPNVYNDSCNLPMNIETNFKDGDIRYGDSISIYGGTHYFADVYINNEKIDVSPEGTYARRYDMRDRDINEGRNKFKIRIVIPERGCIAEKTIYVYKMTKICGNGILENKSKGRVFAEECDDGNTRNGDGCSQYCYKE